jgi:CheY-like chemotaxis protein
MTHRVLIVDDEPAIRQALKQVLEYEGLTTRTAGSGGEAITVFPDYRPHLTFLDVKMAASTTSRRSPACRFSSARHHRDDLGTARCRRRWTPRGAFDSREPLDTDRRS